MEKLPEKIKNDLNSNQMFNTWGLVNLFCLKSRTNHNIPDDKIKDLIIEEFSDEIRFVGATQRS